MIINDPLNRINSSSLSDKKTPPKILSLMEKHMGHGTYGNLLREGFQQSSSVEVDFYWYHEQRQWDTKILRRLLSLSFPHEWIQKQNLDLRRFRAQISYAYMARRLALRKLKQQDYWALHLHTYILGFLSLDLLKKLPTVVSLDMTSSQAAQERTDPKYRWTYYPNVFFGKQVFEAAAGIVTRSQWARQSVIEDYDINPDKVKVIYPGVDLTKLTPPEPAVRQQQKLFNILFVGNDFQRKGGHDVLEVFLHSFSEQAELHLVTNEPIQCQHPHVYIHQGVKAYSSKWLELYRQADVFIMPTYFEGFGWVFIEAMAAGLPAIATGINAIPEMVKDGETGFLIQPGDRRDLAAKIRVLMENPTLSRQMGAKGRQIVEQKFNAQKHCQILEGLFRDVSIPK
jgi:glycosyltransferase involved in cell wall biosynthesis